DGAHNASAIERLAETLREVAAGRTIWLLVGVGMTKGEPLPLFAPLLPLAERVYTCSFRSKRSQPADELARRLAVAHPDVRPLGSPEAAIDALRPNLPAGHLLVCCGSLFLVGEAGEILGATD
ncbi:MAG: hypothetical protein KC609_03590, partial [Myxococcales bacterium]|nr:hypothetical protein [Myxococcales bacterium]